MVRTGRPGAASAALRRARAVSALARRTGCGLDEAAERLTAATTATGTAGSGPGDVGAPRLSRRGFLLGSVATATGLAGVGADSGVAMAAGRRHRRGGPRVVIVGAGIAGLGCAYRLWSRHGIEADLYEYDSVPGGRIRTLRGYFDDGQAVEQHAEFINPEHTVTLALARSFG